MTYKEIQELNAVEPFCFEDNTQEQWYKCGLVEGAKIGYEQAEKDYIEYAQLWVDSGEVNIKSFKQFLKDRGYE